MEKVLYFKDIVDSILDDIDSAKRDAERLHNAGNIRNSGDIIEIIIREKLQLLLPERYLVKQGHIIDANGDVSNQFDILIFDRLNTPNFFEKNQTVFYPIESILAIGEIKKTLRENHIEEFGKKINHVKDDMDRTLVKNPVHNGKIQDNATLADITNMNIHRRYKNSLYCFILAIDVNNVDNLLFLDSPRKNRLDGLYILNHGFFFYGGVKENHPILKLDDESSDRENLFHIQCERHICLANLLNQLIGHLNKSLIEPFSLDKYLMGKQQFGIRRENIKMYDLSGKKNFTKHSLKFSIIDWADQIVSARLRVKFSRLKRAKSIF